MAETRSQSLTHEQVAEVGRCQALLPREADVIAALGEKGHRRKYRPDGTYEWSHPYTTNVGGKLTREAQAVHELMRPFSAADTARHARNQQKVERVALRDRDGQVSYMEPALADATADSTGRRHVWKTRGNPVERGAEGMLWKLVGGEWWPLGVRCLGTPLRGSARVPRGAIQHDPSGLPWAWRSGAWRRA
jgi:hypothetical protein